MNLPIPDDAYLIDRILWERQVVIMLAKEKIGKSILSLQMACALSSGTAFLGEYEVPSPMDILYVQAESTMHETIERMKSMTKIVPWDPKRFHIYYPPSLDLDTELGYNKLLQLIEIKHIRPKVIFMDPLYMCMSNSITDEKTARVMCKNIRRLQVRYDCAILVDHHEHRQKMDQSGYLIEEGDNSIMGSFVWKAFANHIIRIKKKKDGLRLFSCETQRSSKVIKDMELKLNSDPLAFEIHGRPDHKPYIDEVRAFFRVSNKPLCAKDIIEGACLSDSAVRKSLSYLSDHKTGELKKINPGQRPTYYALTNGAGGVK